MLSIEEKRRLAKHISMIAKRAGNMILNDGISDIIEKDGAANVVTDMDIKIQNYIIEECQKCLPDSVFLAEEESMQQVGHQYTWIIDPIDGTTNFVYDYHHSCVSIALYYKMKGLIGVVYNPYLDECFVGIEGVESTCNDKIIHVAHRELDESLVLIGTSTYNKELADKTFEVMKNIFLKTRDIRSSGSAALDLCYVACGRVDAFYEHVLQPWDYAAGNVIIKNAGGIVEPIVENGFIEFKQTGVIASNGICHKELCDIVLEK